MPQLKCVYQQRHEEEEAAEQGFDYGEAVIPAFTWFVGNGDAPYAGAGWEGEHALWYYTCVILHRCNLKDKVAFLQLLILSLWGLASDSTEGKGFLADR